ncbi:three-helix bundle dimerization domain-containing protein [Microbacterium sp. NPDC090007]|uniref:three-helix bundle dimerization domain-containing protein n=1 Tax=Microbacterium sp. NPDC090007 TaxID=3364204 RepID=UPI0038279CCF
MSVTDPADEYEALFHVLVRVSHRFPSVPEETLVELIAGEVSRFGQVRLRAYVPVLVEGNVVRTLRATPRPQT